MSLTPTQELKLKKFAEARRHWPKAELEAAIWRIKWQLQALPHQKDCLLYTSDAADE